MPDKFRKKSATKLLLVLACGATVEQAAKQVGMSERTIYRRLSEPEFQRELAKVRADMVQRTAGTLTAASSEAVKTLVSLLKIEGSPPVRLGAARAILEVGMKLREVADLEQRLLDLEQQLATLAGPDLKLHRAAES
jgi:hypothetical protein